MITIDSVTRTYGASAAVDDASWTAAGLRHRLPGPQRRRQVDHRADTRRTDQGRHIGHLNRVRPQPREPTQPRTRGVLLDAPAQHAGRTGREILTIALPDRGWQGLSDERCKWRSSCYRFSAAGMRSAKVMAKAFRAGFHRTAHRVWPVPLGSRDLVTR